MKQEKEDFSGKLRKIKNGKMNNIENGKCYSFFP